MSAQTTAAPTHPRVEAGLPFVEALARRMAATMPHSIDLSDLVQDGVIGLIDAAERFDEKRGIKFETFAERRVRGAMIDALRKDAWPRGVRRVRRELEAAREKLRLSLGHEPSLADLAAAVGSDEKRLGKTIVRINTIESTSPLSCGDNVDEAQLPAVFVPAEPERPDHAYERGEVRDRVRARHRDAAGPRTSRDLPLLLRRSHDEGNRRRARRQRVARFAAARSCPAPPARGAWPRHGPGRCGSDVAQRHPGVCRPSRKWPRPTFDRRLPFWFLVPSPSLLRQLLRLVVRWSSITPARRARPAASRRDGMAWRASGSRSLRETARRRCPRPRRLRKSPAAPIAGVAAAIAR